MGLKASVGLACKRLVQGYRATSESYVEHLKKIGVAVGEDCVIFSPGRTTIEILNPHLLTIGNHVAMTGPVTILTHDYSVGVTKLWTHGEVLGNQKPVVIGNNVFLGWGCTILAGTIIGDNCVIGAGSVVSGHVEGNSIWGGDSFQKDMQLGALLRAAQGETGRRGRRHLRLLQKTLQRGAAKRGVA